MPHSCTTGSRYSFSARRAPPRSPESSQLRRPVHSGKGQGSHPLQTLNLRPGESASGELDRGQATKLGYGFSEVLEILGDRPIRPNQEKEGTLTTKRRGSIKSPSHRRVDLAISRR